MALALFEGSGVSHGGIIEGIIMGGLLLQARRRTDALLSNLPV
jgi:hypothetical protein